MTAAARPRPSGKIPPKCNDAPPTRSQLITLDVTRGRGNRDKLVMPIAAAAIADEVGRYLRTGETDVLCHAWPGDVVERCRLASGHLRSALVREVASRTAGSAPVYLPKENPGRPCREKVLPMVQGLFPRSERAAILALLEDAFVFVTPGNVESILLEQAGHSEAWDIANLYLGSLGVELLGPAAPRIVGLNAHTKCFVSPEYFRTEQDSFADFVVHEAAHVFHNCKRRTAGLRERRSREWLLDIAFGARENFAYCCEAYACILRRSGSPAERRALAEVFAREFNSPDEWADAATVAAIVREAANARNGWKAILARCASRASNGAEGGPD
jgi:hypothetical protein